MNNAFSRKNNFAIVVKFFDVNGLVLSSLLDLKCINPNYITESYNSKAVFFLLNAAIANLNANSI